MHIEIFDDIGRPRKIKASRVVVFDDFNNPVAVAVKHCTGSMYTGHVGDKEFFNYLQVLGIDKTLVVTEINPKELKKIDLS